MTTKEHDKPETHEIDENISKLFEIKKRLGKGAYGIVWKAIDKRTNETLAVKKIFDAFRDETDAQRTFREIIFLKAFRSHPNVVRLHNVYTARNNMDIYLTFEFMESDLHNIIKKGTILKDIHKRYVMYQLANAIRYIHSGNVIHRDLKPSNVLIDSKCRCKLADFGLARSVSKVEQSHMGSDQMAQPLLTDYVATRWYRAPEILVASKRYTKGIDMWSLGCILGEMIYGKPLFQGTSTINQIEKIVSALPDITDHEIRAVGAGFGSVLLSKQLTREDNCSLDDLLTNGPSDARKLVKSLLVLDPLARLTASETIDHSYVEKFRNSIPEIELNVDVVPPFRDDVRLTVPEYRSKLYEIVQVPNDKTHYFHQPKQANISNTITTTTTTTTTTTATANGKSRDQRMLRDAEVNTKKFSKSIKSHNSVSEEKNRSRQDIEIHPVMSCTSITNKSKSRAGSSPVMVKYRSLPKTKKCIPIEVKSVQDTNGHCIAVIAPRSKTHNKASDRREDSMRAPLSAKRHSIDYSYASLPDGVRQTPTLHDATKHVERQQRSSSLANHHGEHTTDPHAQARQHNQHNQHNQQIHGQGRQTAQPSVERDSRELHRLDANNRANKTLHVQNTKLDTIATMAAMETPPSEPSDLMVTRQSRHCYEKRLKKLEDEIERYKREVRYYCKGSQPSHQPQAQQQQQQRAHSKQQHSPTDNAPNNKYNGDSMNVMPVTKMGNPFSERIKKNPYFQIMSKGIPDYDKQEYDFTYNGTGGSGDHIARPQQNDLEKIGGRQQHAEKQHQHQHQHHDRTNHYYQSQNNYEQQTREHHNHQQRQPVGGKQQPHHLQQQHSQQPSQQRIKPISKFHLRSHTSTRPNY